MRANVGNVDKVVRIVVGTGLLLVLFVVEGSARYIGLLGLVLLGTAFFGVCPLYSIFGISTCRVEHKGD